MNVKNCRERVIHKLAFQIHLRSGRPFLSLFLRFPRNQRRLVENKMSRDGKYRREWRCFGEGERQESEHVPIYGQGVFRKSGHGGHRSYYQSLA
jgi:hypothetical protein